MNVYFCAKNAMNMDYKIFCFEYMLFQLMEWYRDLRPSQNPLNSFTRLKSLKLLFFVATVEASESNEGLLSIFDNFYAMGNGPVESDVYNAMVENTMSIFDFSDRCPLQKCEVEDSTFDAIDRDVKEQIQHSIKILRERNPSIILYTPFQLVELSHTRESWSVAMEIASLLGKGSAKMNKFLMQSENKSFQ
jgi:uncharacterized phage-associated protein